METLPFRIKIGVTGHRKGIPEAALKEKLRSVLNLSHLTKGKSIPQDSIFSLCGPSTLESLRNLQKTPLTLCIYTALAEGADRIVSEPIMETENSVMKVVLPLVQEEYEEDFETEESLNQFRLLLSMDPNPIRLRHKRLLEECLPEEVLDQRRNAYYNAGKFIVDECDVLIGIWDGLPGKGRGGTKDIIEYAKSIQRPIILINCHDVSKVEFMGQLNFSPVMLTEFDHFNQFRPEEEIWKHYLHDLHKEYFDMEKFPEVNALDETRKNEMIQYVFRPYAKASILARYFKKRYMRVGLLIYVFSTVAVGIVLLSVIFNVLSVWAFVMEFLLLAVIYTSIRFAREAKVHARWLGYRFLAERVRSTSYFFLAGYRYEDPANPQSNEYNSRQDASSILYDEIWWPVIRLHHDEYNNNPPGAVDPVVVEYVRKSYVDEQLRFQQRYSKKHHKKNEKLERAGGWLFFFAMLSAVLHVLLHIKHDWIHGMEWINQVLTFLALIFPTIAAALEGIRHKNEYARNTHRSAIMMEELQKLSLAYNGITNNHEFAHVLKKSANLILSDNEDWRNLMRERELEIVV